MNVSVVGISFKTASLSLHETFARQARILFQSAQSAVLLSTCNRTEIYFSEGNFAEQFVFDEGVYLYSGDACFVHLCRVASGLDSAMIAETEILRQVKMAYARACETSILPRNLHYLFQKAFKIAKSVRSQFFFNVAPPTLFSILWQLMTQYSVASPNILLVGYSEIHRKFAAFLSRKGNANVTFCTRTVGQGVFPMKDRSELQNWNDYDVISCASQSDDFLIRGKGKRKHLIFDLSVPRNVDPRIEGEGVILLNIEQINELIDQKKDCLQECVEASETYLRNAVERLMSLYIERYDGFVCFL